MGIVLVAIGFLFLFLLRGLLFQLIFVVIGVIGLVIGFVLILVGLGLIFGRRATRGRIRWHA